MIEKYSSAFIRFIRKSYNKYILVGLLFLMWIAFFDKNSFVEKAYIRHKITGLNREKAYYQKKIEEDKRKLEELLSSRENLEKFAREQYLMKNENEDIFLIVDE